MKFYHSTNFRVFQEPLTKCHMEMHEKKKAMMEQRRAMMEGAGVAGESGVDKMDRSRPPPPPMDPCMMPRDGPMQGKA